MIEDVREEVLRYNNYLLLQGPKGFFFYSLAKFLKSLGKNVYKINFNGGDFLTFPLFKHALNYRGKIEDFRNYLKEIIFSKNIDVVLIYGDYRPYHRIAVDLCKEIEISVYVFEEGYVRPDYITLEKSGINGWSKLPKNPAFYKNLPEIEVPRPLSVNHSYFKRTFSRVIHYFFLELFKWYFPHYVPYKKYFPYLSTIYFWLRGVTIRKVLYKIKERKIFKLLTNELKNKYFLVPLQVYNDSQIILHSNYNSIEEFITEVMESFAKYSKKDTYLVFKHHPEDRGFKNYEKHIRKLAKRLYIENRVFYIHDFHLPTLIKGSIGVITINSTVGLQALYHNRPVKVMGKAIYDIPGLTFQEDLDKFWENPGYIDRELFSKFRKYVIITTQLNGSFYGRFPFSKEILFTIKSKSLRAASSTVKRWVSRIRSGFSGSS